MQITSAIHRTANAAKREQKKAVVRPAEEVMISGSVFMYCMQCTLGILSTTVTEQNRKEQKREEKNTMACYKETAQRVKRECNSSEGDGCFRAALTPHTFY